MSIRAQGDGNSSGQTKISNLESTLSINQQVLWLQVSVKDSASMTEVQSQNHLIHVTL